MITLLSSPYILESSYRRFEKNEKHVTRYPSHYVLIFMLEGCLYFEEDQVPVSLQKGQWYIQQPHKLQEGVHPSDEPYYYYIHFNIPSEHPALVHLTLPHQGMFTPSLLTPYFDMLEETKAFSNDYFIDFQLTFLKLLKDLMITSKATHSPQRKLAEEIIHYIEQNPTLDALPKHLEQHFSFSYTTLSKVTKKHYHTTPVQYMTDLRLRKAQYLLASTDYTVEHIAQLVGYNELSVFFKAFKSIYNVAPGMFRQNIRGEY